MESDLDKQIDLCMLTKSQQNSYGFLHDRQQLAFTSSSSPVPELLCKKTFSRRGVIKSANDFDGSHGQGSMTGKQI